MLKIGHRGAPPFAPENTLTSFRKAIELGGDGVELDVHLCQSGEPVVIHDDTVNRTTNGKGKVSQMSLAEIRALKAKGDEHIPTLEEVFTELGQNAWYFVEIKHTDATVPTVKLIHDHVTRGWKPERIMLISFLHEALVDARHALPSLLIGASFDQLTQTSIKQAESLGACAILPNYRMLNEIHVRHAKESKLKVIPWTVNDRVDITRTRLMGVHGMMSDYPDRLNA